MFTILGEMTDGDKRINPLHFVSIAADIRIWIIWKSGFES